MRCFPPCRYALAHEGARRPVPARVLRAQYGGDFELLARGARLHAAAPDGLPPLATAHLPTVAAVFATPLTRALVERIGADPEFAAADTLAVAFPLLRGGPLKVRRNRAPLCCSTHRVPCSTVVSVAG